MNTGSPETYSSRHHGMNIQKIRVYMNVKQQTLAHELGISQQGISNLEKQPNIDDDMLGKVADVLGVSLEMIKQFDEKNVINNINNVRDCNFSDNSINSVAGTFNPVEKIVELYERLLASEKEKVELLKYKDDNNKLA
ncbi:helix-turn-helix transcriptional regulator [Chitinophaga pendula]|uniref:helix-turn-helix domain-containing protein n=1 Tax=Chitinophaga TaxID=79328 RepID=UPI000BAEAD22|nr:MULTISPECIES: helix-turn-helix transcriptional regulator [Chitinophaga]ASZ15086.1 transcriptional regulator [Chitinophaga sp. MD30]UCJ08646.1 helix-turn-helix transcriptional regulator [Chitinophaga pendula]